jgi:hypoxanthine-guanine phosphoribosyltransferase
VIAGHARVAAVGQASLDYADKELVLVAMLKGAMVFLGDLLRASAPGQFELSTTQQSGDGERIDPTFATKSS